MRMGREELLRLLESLQPGLAKSDDEVEQGSCFIFDNGTVYTFNDEIACRHECALDLTGAVVAMPLLSMLRNMPESEVDLVKTKDYLLLKGKRKKTKVRFESDITIPSETLEKPKKNAWKEINEKFVDAIEAVQHCAGKDREGKYYLTCVHLHPLWIEATDNFHGARYRLKTGIKESTLVRRDSVKHITQLGMIEFAETETWIHFRNTAGLIVSCRRYTEVFPDLKLWLKPDGGKVTSLPKGLIDAAKRADIAASDKSENTDILVQLRNGKMKLSGEGTSIIHEEFKTVKYKGSSIEFVIPPKQLIEIVKRHHECRVSADKMRIKGGPFTYVISLGTKDEEEAE